jgi:hypothetical protein
MVRRRSLSLCLVHTRSMANFQVDVGAARTADIVRYTDKYKTAEAKPATLDPKDYAPRELQPQALYDSYYTPEAAKKRAASAAGLKGASSRLRSMCSCLGLSGWDRADDAHDDDCRQEGSQEGQSRRHRVGRRRFGRRGAFLLSAVLARFR